MYTTKEVKSKLEAKHNERVSIKDWDYINNWINWQLEDMEGTLTIYTTMFGYALISVEYYNDKTGKLNQKQLVRKLKGNSVQYNGHNYLAVR